MRFFVVRKNFAGDPTFSIEHGDYTDRYTKQHKAQMLHRVEIPDSITLTAAIAAYRQAKGKANETKTANSTPSVTKTD